MISYDAQCTLNARWTGLISRTYQYYTANDCQTTSGHSSRRSAWGRDKRLWREWFSEKESFKTWVENATRNVNKRSRMRAWRRRRAGWWYGPYW